MKHTGVAMELHSSPSRLGIDEHTVRWRATWASRWSFNSDAHGVRELSYLRYGSTFSTA